MKHPSSRTVLAVAAVFLLGAASACGDDDDASDTTGAAATAAPAGTEAPAGTDAPAATEGPTATEAPAGTEAPTGTEAEGGGEVVMTAESDLGTHLVDEEGLTLYLFLPDAQGPSTCEGDCLAAWPAVAGPATAGAGADAALLGTAVRPDDGSEQATYNGWPLYYFAQDTAPGDVNGQGLGDNWWIVSPTGEAISGT